jgi:energy-converting hydrogenase Eha subunit G
MRPWITAGVGIAVLALACYSVGTAAHQRQLRVTRLALSFLGAGLLLDVLATACMVMGTATPGLTLHGAIGYSALAGMALETALAWRHRRANRDERVTSGLATWSRVAYAYWLFAFVSAGALAAAARA